MNEVERRKCIGVFLGQPNLPFQADVLKHVKDYAFAVGSNVVVFSTMTYTGGYPDYQYGESKNVELANFDTIDAVIILPDTLQGSPGSGPEVLEYVSRHFNGPKVSLDMAAEDYQQFFSDDMETSAQLVSHLIEEHQCSDIAYMTGHKGHPHSIDRLNGYYKALREHELPIDESRVFYGDFWYEEGERVVEALIHSEKGLPQAIACANDAMAVSVYNALTERNYRVPEDVKLTGFDHTGNASGGDYPITSAKRNVSEMVERAMHYIFREWGLTDIPKFEKKERIILNTSCGCKIDRKPTYRIQNEHVYSGFYSFHNFMLEDMISSENIESCIWKIDWYAGENIKFLNKFSHLRICLCDDWNTFKPEEHDGRFTDKVSLALDKRPGDMGDRDIRFGMDVVFQRKDYFPGFGDPAKAPAIYYFNVLHFGQSCFGYLVLSYNDKCEDHVFDDVYIMWVRKINAALESLRRQYAVEALRIAAEERAIKDTMTGLYNRNGYNQMLSEMIADINSDEIFAYLFFDNNGLKYVNDTYGHVAGDDVISQTARAISKTYFPSARKEVNFRIGGDEYVKLVVGHINSEMAENCISSISEELDKINAEGTREYKIYVAGGFQLYTSDTIMSPDDIMKAADTQMYINKEHVKETTGFCPKRNNF